MAANKHHDPSEQRLPDLSDPSQRFEKRDVDFRAITRFGIGLFILCVASFALLLGVFKFFLDQEKAAQAPRPSDIARHRVPPEPRLQATPVKDLATIRAEEDAILNNYTWVDKEKGVVRMPIDKAIDALVAKGLPARSSAPAPLSSAIVPTESGLGAVMQQEGGPLASELKAVLAESPSSAEKSVEAKKSAERAPEKSAPAAEKK